eukprot:CAMPEP_0113712224 /NCGR_PEP_ID=MMETSP0038_2-20120614/31259_1 /TAXON_ID=2898 /ORGANISM="Cryptomonas paramecium" /LENGTH=64 /DNA_ID=CAMNT_0000638699 /DNA_START=15 /DNA_END=206 /DNA_ORIENTATION=- /assembly_acc=CAM_ASM_000170
MIAATDENSTWRRDLPFLLMTIQTSVAQARADLAEVRTELESCLKAWRDSPLPIGDVPFRTPVA